MRICATTLVPVVFGVCTLVYTGWADSWVRSYVGDALVVAFLVGLLDTLPRLFRRPSPSMVLRMSAVALLAFALEMGQWLWPQADRGSIAVLLLGAHFDPWDFAAYALGLVLALLLDRISQASPAQASLD